MTELFENEIRIEHEERVRKENWDRKLREIRGDNIYTDFCIDCRCRGVAEKRKSEIEFANWLKAKNINLNFWQRKHIAETYFGYNFVFEHTKKTWKIEKQ